MATPQKKNSTTNSDSMVLRWQFRRAHQMLTCGITANGPATFDVITVPHWNVSGGSVETFTCPKAALERHAAIASGLRAAGWLTAAYSR